MRSTFLLVSVLLAACSETPAPINEAEITPPAVEQIKEPTIEAATVVVASKKCDKLLTGYVASLSGDTSRICGEIGSYLSGDVSNITGDVTGLNGNVTDLSGDVTNIDGWIDAGKSHGDVSDLVGNINCLAGDLAPLSGNVSDLNARICKETRITELRSELDQLTNP